MNEVEQDSYWNTQLSKLKKANLLRRLVPRHQGYRQKLDHWKSGDITFNVGCDDHNQWVHVDITMKGQFRLSWFTRLARRQAELTRLVEADLNMDGDASHLKWIWAPRDEEGESWIILRRHGLNLSDKSSREDGQLWVTGAIRAFGRHLVPLLDTL
jgi:hypothetical protein